jgi:hypothetical protein
MILTIFIGCSQSKETPKDKIDPALFEAIAKLDEIKSKEIIDFIGTCNSEITSTIKDDIETAGINIHTISKNIFTASGNYKSILKIENKDYIKWLELPQKLHPLKNN